MAGTEAPGANKRGSEKAEARDKQPVPSKKPRTTVQAAAAADPTPKPPAAAKKQGGKRDAAAAAVTAADPAPATGTQTAVESTQAAAAKKSRPSKGASAAKAVSASVPASKDGIEAPVSQAVPPSKKPTAVKETVDNVDSAQEGNGRDGDDALEVPAPGSPRRRAAATTAKNYKESAVSDRPNKSEMVNLKQEPVVATEALALEQTGGKHVLRRRLDDFSIVDATGEVVSLERGRLLPDGAWLTGAIYGTESTTETESKAASRKAAAPQAAASKAKPKAVNPKAAGRRVSKPFGPITGFTTTYTKDEYKVTVKTADAVYELGKPMTSYRKIHVQLEDQLLVCHQVYLALCPAVGGDATATFEQVVAKLERAQIGRKYGGSRTTLLLNCRFVLSQLESMSVQDNQGKGVDYRATAFAQALEAKGAANNDAEAGTTAAGTICITDGDQGVTKVPTSDDPLANLDAEMAARVQAEFNANDTGRARGTAASAGQYILIKDEEIVDEYPEPVLYKKVFDETDELMIIDPAEVMGTDSNSDDFPRNRLTNFTFYNGEALLSALERVPMFNGADHNVDLFGSGVFKAWDNDNYNAGAIPKITPPEGAEITAGGAVAEEDNSFRVSLSQIREWNLEVDGDNLYINIRTDVSWYRLEQPSAEYAPWYKVLVKVVQLAITVITMVSDESRAAKLSFSDAAKLLAELPATAPGFVSAKVAEVERYLIVHGQIILNQFKHWYEKRVQTCSFATTLKDKMAHAKHSKLYVSKRKGSKALASASRTNANPMRGAAATGLKAKPMPATSTGLVKHVWKGYFFGAKVLDEDAAEAEQAALAKEVDDPELGEEKEEEEGEELETALAETAKPKAAAKAKKAAAKPASKAVAVSWEGSVLRKDAAGRTLHSAACVGDVHIALGDVVVLKDGDGAQVIQGEEPEGPLGRIVCMYQQDKGTCMLQVRAMLRGCDTLLGDVASDCELFITEDVKVYPLKDVVAKLCVTRLERPWDPTRRIDHFAEDEARRSRNAALVEANKPMEYFWRVLYRVKDGMFCTVTPEVLALDGVFVEAPTEPVALAGLPNKAGFILKGVEYKLGEVLYLHPEAFGPAPAQEEKLIDDDGEEVPLYRSDPTRIKSSYSTNLRPFPLVQLVEVHSTKSGEPTELTVRRFYRPEDISKELAYKADWWDVYAGPLSDAQRVQMDMVVSKAAVRLPSGPGKTGDAGTKLDTFCVVGSYDPKTPDVTGPPPADVSVSNPTKKGAAGSSKAKKADKQPLTNTVLLAFSDADGKDAPPAVEEADGDGVAMNSLDIFAGCGGLTEGMHQAGVAKAKWAIEYEPIAADAFKLNNQDCQVFANNCNVLLQAAMAKAGMSSDCHACDDCTEASGKLSADYVAGLPEPGQVDFIMGGPPCQGYSGMNRFNKSNWSLVQNSMVMAYLSYADFYRPRYFLLENVRNFVSHNKSFTFRLTVRTLVEMGYQVRFGVLNAGNYGVPQSRKRTIIWAAAPDEQLPSWPKPRHVFHTPQLTIKLPGGVEYTAVPNLPGKGAALRAVTVKDAIADLPPIENGHNKDRAEYTQEATSAFQKKIRKGATELLDHVCKPLNEINLERCKCIPTNTPGADWHELEHIVKKDPKREWFNGKPLIPWCLPNTAARNNGWRGLFGRLDLSGHFPTSTTDPQPMGKVGQVLHPIQHRIMSVRECARSQGFPDTFKFAGTVPNKHRQVGNAVPPPLAYALGSELRLVLEARKRAIQSDALAQMA